ncbi:hypothetical protein RCL_jg4545.t1 [Rhizophagus clarus]|uniref:Uncharacterized protein n=1 Tax=Rhizophagus clarus TaxID=94130 RepID=A0A8H3KTX5_9GLOM|nr:hypothetical protein RCL_jg4545.t1 [Rhizophagus clarus]
MNMTSEYMVNIQSEDFKAVYNQVQQATIINDFFSTFKMILDDNSFRWALQHSSLFAKDMSKEEYQRYLRKTTFLVHEDTFTTATALYKDNDLLKNMLDDSYDPYHLSDDL